MGVHMDLAYYWYEAAHLMLSPARAASDATRLIFNNPINPLTHTPYGRTVSAACELFERTTRRYGKPAFDRAFSFPHRPQPKILLVAPMSGHFATLLRGTVETFLPSHQVMITDWADARMVPLTAGSFDLDDYIDYLISMFRALGPDLHVMAVCQPAVPVMAAVARMEAENDPYTPRSMVLMGGPIDTRRSPTAVNQIAQERGVEWFRRNCIVKVPGSYPGFWRDVYPGFLQLSGFMAMNMDRHLTAHYDMYKHLVRGDGDSAEKHREFYDEYLAVMDLTAEYYLQTVETVFVNHELPDNKMMHRDKPVDLKAIRRCAIMAIEGEKDDISGVGQTLAALQLTPNLPVEKKVYHLQLGVGHYGVFNGSRFRAETAPRIADFILNQRMETAAARPAPRLRKVVG
jgi:poly(3-hydroxybutyrate) depolymerase